MASCQPGVDGQAVECTGGLVCEAKQMLFGRVVDPTLNVRLGGIGVHDFVDPAASVVQVNHGAIGAVEIYARRSRAFRRPYERTVADKPKVVVQIDPRILLFG